MSWLMVLKVYTLTLKAVDAFLLLVSSKPFTHSNFQKLSMLLVWQSALQTKAVIRYHMVMDKLSPVFLAHLKLKVETLCRVKLSRFPFRVCTVCYLSSPFEWREIHCKPHSWNVICISQEGEKEMDWQGEKGKGKGIMEEEKIESERRRKGLHFVSRDDSIERTERRRRVNAGFKRPHSCRGLCWCARKLLSLEESETPVRWWASCMSCFLSASLVFFPHHWFMDQLDHPRWLWSNVFLKRPHRLLWNDQWRWLQLLLGCPQAVSTFSTWHSRHCFIGSPKCGQVHKFKGGLL